MSSISEYKEHFDVLIVGAGMVGTAIACGLGSEGIRVALFDQSELTALPVNELPGLRVSALSSASENILKNLGAWSHMKTMRMTPYRRMAVWEKLHTPWGTELSSRTNRVMFNASKIGHDQLGYIVENRVTQLGLLASAKACSNITFFCPAIIDRIQTSEAKPEIQLANGQRFSGDLLIGADGAHSIVRKSAGIGIKQRDYEQQCFVATVEIVGGCQDITWQAFTPTGPEAFLPLPDVNGKSYASIVWYHQPEKVRELLSFSDESLINELTNTFPEELPGILKVCERGAFPIARRHALHYFCQGVVLAGDAAHTINPLAGQGVNLGFQDAAWLISVLKNAFYAKENLGSPEVLQRYEKVRRKNNMMMINVMDGFYHSFSNQNRPLQLLRNAGLTIAGQLSPAVNQIMKYAMGLSGRQPPLATMHHLKDGGIRNNRTVLRKTLMPVLTSKA